MCPSSVPSSRHVLIACTVPTDANIFAVANIMPVNMHLKGPCNLAHHAGVVIQEVQEDDQLAAGVDEDGARCMGSGVWWGGIG